MKYITYEERDGCQRYIIFDDITDHIFIKSHMNIENILGAGFISFNSDGPYCYGESVTLKVKSRGSEDNRLIRRLNEMI